MEDMKWDIWNRENIVTAPYIWRSTEFRPRIGTGANCWKHPRRWRYHTAGTRNAACVRTQRYIMRILQVWPNGREQECSDNKKEFYFEHVLSIDLWKYKHLTEAQQPEMHSEWALSLGAFALPLKLLVRMCRREIYTKFIKGNLRFSHAYQSVANQRQTANSWMIKAMDS
jgi:hypothetical protein